MAKELTQTAIEKKILYSANKLFSEKGFDNVIMQKGLSALVFSVLG